MFQYSHWFFGNWKTLNLWANVVCLEPLLEIWDLGLIRGNFPRFRSLGGALWDRKRNLESSCKLRMDGRQTCFWLILILIVKTRKSVGWLKLNLDTKKGVLKGNNGVILGKWKLSNHHVNWFLKPSTMDLIPTI